MTSTKIFLLQRIQHEFSIYFCWMLLKSSDDVASVVGHYLLILLQRLKFRLKRLPKGCNGKVLIRHRTWKARVNQNITVQKDTWISAQLKCQTADLNLYSNRAYLIDVLWCQPIKLMQVVSTSEFHEYWWKNVDFIFFVPSIYCRASEVTT